MNLTQLDYEILEFISNFDSIDKETILNKFPSQSKVTKYSLELLSKPEYKNSSGISIPIKNTNYIREIFKTEKDEFGISHFISLNSFSITPKGQKALQNYKLQTKNENDKAKKDMILRILPIVISLIALIKSFSAEITSIWQSLMQLLK